MIVSVGFRKTVAVLLELFALSCDTSILTHGLFILKALM